MIIGLHGKKRSGKDTVFQFIQKHHTGKVVRRAFADPLKLSAYRLFYPDGTLDEALAWADEMKADGYVDMIYDAGRGAHLSGREFLQNYGTEAHRDVFGPDFWVDASLPRWDGMGHTESGLFDVDFMTDFVVFTDVRFENEAKRIKEWGGEIWEIQRFDEDDADSHASEKRLPEELIDAILYNRYSLEELDRLVEAKLAIRRAFPEVYPNG